jgi:POT family proton-dependent oligopeptide transporter
MAEREWIIYVTLPALLVIWRERYNCQYTTRCAGHVVVVNRRIWFMVTQCTKVERDRMMVV